MKRFRWVLVGLMLLVSLRLLATQTSWIEHYYSRGFYPLWRQFTHVVFDRIPFSVGDLAYTFLGVYLLVSVFKARKGKWKAWGIHVLHLAMGIMLFFQLSWGLNYHRIPYAQQLEIADIEIDSLDLYAWTEFLIERTNATHQKLGADSTAPIRFENSVYDWKPQLEKAYQKLHARHAAIQLLPTQPKASMYSTGLSYMGFAGYLNPFTLEAQTNALMPSYQQAFTSAHEIAHQMGTANESECNWLAYMACSQSENPRLQYSAYATALRYAFRYVYASDSLRMRAYERQLLPGVMANYQESQAHWKKYENPVDRVLEKVYDGFLKANSQSEGMEGYSRFVPLALRYHRRYAPLRPVGEEPNPIQ